MNLKFNILAILSYSILFQLATWTNAEGFLKQSTQRVLEEEVEEQDEFCKAPIIFLQAVVSDKVNITFYEDGAKQLIDSTIYQQDRFEGHISTDKVIYKKNDVIFIEVLVIDAFKKTPVGLNDTSSSINEVTMNINDPLGNSIFTTTSQVWNSTAAFTFKIPIDASGGIYTIKAYSYNMPSAARVIQIRNEAKDSLVADIKFDQMIYYAGDTAYVQINLTNADGSKFTESPQSLVEINFDEMTNFQKGIQLSLDGIGNLSFTIPQNIVQLQLLASFTFNYLQLTEVYSSIINIGQPQQFIIDFVPETAYYVYDVPNKVYYQCFSSLQRSDVVDIKEAVLYSRNAEQSASGELKTEISSVSTMHRGKGYFVFKPVIGRQYFLRTNLGLKNGSVDRMIPIEMQNRNIRFQLQFSILNRNKVLNPTEDLRVIFYSNNNTLENDTYLLQVMQKEVSLYTQVFQFKKNQEDQTVIPSNIFQSLNGGVLSLTVAKLAPTVTNAQQDQKRPPVFQWELEKGEILFFVNPPQILEFGIVLDQESYEPGNNVSFTIKQLETENQQLSIQDDCYVSVVVTDNSIFGNVPEKQQPLSLPTQVYLEHEILLDEYEFNYANEYLNHNYNDNSLYNNNQDSSDLNLELLLGVQSWRYGYFFLNKIIDWQNNATTMSEAEKDALENLFGFIFVPKPVDNVGMWPVMEVAAAGAMPGVPLANPVLNEPMIDVMPGIAAPGFGFLPPQQQNQQTLSTIEQAEVNDFMFGIMQNARNYSHQLQKIIGSSVRNDLTETVMYASAVKLQNRSLTLNFSLSDLIISFRVTVNGFDVKGSYGFSTSTFQSSKNFYIQAQAPISMIVGDELQVPMYLRSQINSTISILVSTQSQNSIQSTLDQSYTVVSPNGISKNIITLKALNPNKKIELKLVVVGADENGKDYYDSIILYIDVQQRGILQQINAGGYIGTQINQDAIKPTANLQFALPTSVVEGSTQVNGKVFTTNYDNLVESVASIIQKPCGCFEQASATVFPMIMAKEFLTGLPIQDDQVATYTTQIQDNLNDGYTLLTSYKTAENGYEWFGSLPSSEPLSAYGLLLFTEMGGITQSLVDAQMIEQLKQWLISRKDGMGGFLQSPVALDTFGRAPLNITNAYIVWALVSAGVQDLELEIDSIIQIAQDQLTQTSKADPYFLSLVSITAHKTNRTQIAQQLADKVKEFQDESGKVTGAETSITSSSGKNLDIETTAIAVLAWLNDKQRYSEDIQNAIDWLVQQVEGGAYGSTQGTVLSLKAITSYMTDVSGINGEGNFVLVLNNQTYIQNVTFNKDQKNTIVLGGNLPDNVEKEILSQLIQLSIDNFTTSEGNQNATDLKVQYSLTIDYYDNTPISSSNSSIDFEVKPIISASVDENATDSATTNVSTIGKTFNYNLTLRNKKADKGQGMVVAIFRVPSCFTISYEMLNQLKSKGLIAAYEVKNSNTEIVFYWRQLAPGESVSIQVSLVKEFEGVCQSKPSNAYLYYDESQTVWSSLPRQNGDGIPLQ